MDKPINFYTRLNSILKVIILFFVFSCFTENANAQGSKIRGDDSSFRTYFLSMPSQIIGKTKGIIIMQIDYDDLRFLKEEDYFKAAYEMSIEILDANENIIERRYWSETIQVTDFIETLNTSNFFVKRVDFLLEPGIYRYVVQMTDADSKKIFQRKGSRSISSYWNDFSGISDIIFTRTTEIDTSLHTFIPPDELIREDYTVGFSAQFQIFSADNQPVDFVWRIYNFINQSAPIHGDSLRLNPGSHIVDIDIPFEGSSFHPGIYLLRTTLYHPLGGKKEKLKRFNLIWTDRPLSSYNISESLEQMTYIISHDEFDRIQNMSDEEKYNFFVSFWKNHDLNPETEKNELMEEYFCRIEKANQEFTVKDKLGWKSDRGRIFCIYGIPDVRQKRKSIDVTAPSLEIWIYNDARKRFIFEEISGSEDCILVSEVDTPR